MVFRRSPLLVLVLAISVAACGPPEAQDDFYEVQPTRECLVDQGFRISTDPDDLGFITATATGGGLRAYVKGGSNSVTIAFGNTNEEAQQMVTAFERVATTPNQKQRLKSLLEGQGNAVLVWITEPSEEQRELVRDCLQ